MPLYLRHQILNLVQSALLLAGMAAIGWKIVSAIAGPQLTLAIVAGWIGGLLFAPAIPERILLNAHRARHLTGRDFRDGIAILAELARRANFARLPELYYIPSRLPIAFAIGNPNESVVCVSDGLLRLMNQCELAGVLTHEIAHIANRDSGSWDWPARCRGLCRLRRGSVS